MQSITDLMRLMYRAEVDNDQDALQELNEIYQRSKEDDSFAYWLDDADCDAIWDAAPENSLHRYCGVCKTNNTTVELRTIDLSKGTLFTENGKTVKKLDDFKKSKLELMGYNYSYPIRSKEHLALMVDCEIENNLSAWISEVLNRKIVEELLNGKATIKPETIPTICNALEGWIYPLVRNNAIDIHLNAANEVERISLEHNICIGRAKTYILASLKDFVVWRTRFNVWVCEVHYNGESDNPSYQFNFAVHFNVANKWQSPLTIEGRQYSNVVVH